MVKQQTRLARLILLFCSIGCCGIFIYITINQSVVALEEKPPVNPTANNASFQIVGTVINDNTSAPIENAEVHAFRSQQSASDSFFLTDSSGQYTLTLTTGKTYALVFNPPSGESLASKAVGGISGANTVNVSLESGFTISGIVYEDLSFTTPVGDVEIFAFNLNTAEGFGLPPADGSGNYSIALTAGTWEITFTPPSGLGFGPAQLDEFVLTKDEAVSVGLSAGFTVSGQVKNGGTPVEDVEVFAQKSDLSIGFGSSPTDANGFYTATLPLGTYDIRFQPQPESGFSSVIKESISGPSNQTVNVSLQAGMIFEGTLSEICTDGSVNLSPNTFVYASPLPNIPTGGLGGWGEFTGTDGTFSLSLPASTYTVTLTPPTSSGIPPVTIFGFKIVSDVTYNGVLSCTYLPIISR